MRLKDGKISASLEDYLEAILFLTKDGREARSKDIAENLAVAKSSVTGALRLLREKELVNYRAYGRISLTESGRAAAESVARKHAILKLFFSDVLGVEPQKAQRAACRAEHALGPETISRLLALVEFVKGPDPSAQAFIERFKEYLQDHIKNGVFTGLSLRIFGEHDENHQ